MSRNITTLEKAIILVLIAAALLGAGGYFLVLPEYRKIAVVDAQITQKTAEIAQAEQLRVTVDEIYDVFERRLDRAMNVHHRFYDEMTTTEAVVKVQEILAGFQGGIREVGGINVTDIGEVSLSVQLFTGQRSINYGLRNLAFVFGQPAVEEAAQETAYDEFGNPIVSHADPLQELIDHIFGEEPDFDDPEVLQKFEDIISSRALLINEIIGALSVTGRDALSYQSRAAFVELIRLFLFLEKSSVGLITASLELELTYSQYLDFLDYVNNLPQITLISSASLWQNISAASDEPQIYEFALRLCVMKPLVVGTERPARFDAPVADAVTETDGEAEEPQTISPEDVA